MPPVSIVLCAASIMVSPCFAVEQQGSSTPAMQVEMGAGVAMHIDNAEVRDVARVFTAILGVQYAVAPSVRERITMTHVNVPRGELHHAFVRSLRKSCLTIVRDGQGYNIVPLIFLLTGGRAELRSRIVALQQQTFRETDSDHHRRISAIGEIGYDSVDTARDAIAALPGANLSPESGLDDIVDTDGVTHWATSRDAVFKAVVETAPDATIQVKPSALCQGNDISCDTSLESFALTSWLQAERAEARAAGCPAGAGSPAAR